MKLDGKSYVEIGLVLSFASFSSFLGTQYGRINSAEASIINLRERLITQVDGLSDIRDRLSRIEGMLVRMSDESGGKKHK